MPKIRLDIFEKLSCSALGTPSSPSLHDKALSLRHFQVRRFPAMNASCLAMVADIRPHQEADRIAHRNHKSDTSDIQETLRPGRVGRKGRF